MISRWEKTCLRKDVLSKQWLVEYGNSDYKTFCNDNYNTTHIGLTIQKCK
jgi:hypothetical protein